MLKMATYPGMSLGGEVRESISLDEDDLSDVEDEVFIRDGRNSYKLAEELNVKRPLMAPRRKLGKSDLTSRLKAKPPCKAFCKPCCYIFAALTVLIGLIALVVILVSIFPLPLDKFRDWVISRSRPVQKIKLLPCSNLKITDVWAVNLPVLTTESPIRLVDLDRDGTDDIIFGFGTGDNYNVLSPDTFCQIFLGVPPPCKGGVIALNGTTGEIVWRYRINDTIFGLQCSADLNGDGLEDCLATGDEGSLVAIDSRNGSQIWLQNNSKMDVIVANLVPDQNNDSVADILASHSSFNEREGHLVLISGKTGKELKRIHLKRKAYFMPQLSKVNQSEFVIFGDGGPNSPGNLSLVSLTSLFRENLTVRTLYEDRFKGVLAQSVFVDITGDNISDIVTAMYNSTIVAIDGFTLNQIWNYTIPNSESNVTPTPAYFNDDNITDFLVIYEKYDDILNYNYTTAYIIDGKTGRPIYTKPIGGSIGSPMSGDLTLGMESFGFDMFLFWTTECTNVEIYAKKVFVKDNYDSTTDVCRQQFNTTTIMKLNALNQFDQPPGFEIYNSVNRTSLEFGDVKSPMKQIREYFIKHPKMQVAQGQGEMDENYGDDSQKIRVHKYGSSSFRHKDNRQGIVKDYMNDNQKNNNNPEISEGMEPKYENEYDWPANQDMMNMLPGDVDPDMNNYNLDESDNGDLFNQQQMLYKDTSKSSRDPRSKQDSDQKTKQSKKKNLSDPKYGVYDYENIKKARNRLLHDLSNLPDEILRDTYFKTRESQLRRSKFEQRDITSHMDKMKQNEELRTIIDKERKAADNSSYNLWDLESEKELRDKENGYWRGKREANFTFTGIPKISSVGAVVNSLNSKSNTIDIIFITYWVPSGFTHHSGTLEQELTDCIEEKLNGSEDHSYQKTTKEEQRELYTRDCLNEQQNLKSQFRYFERLQQLNLGRMTVYRLQIECLCDVLKVGDRCAQFLPGSEQSWPMYLGKLGDGFYKTRN